MAFYPYPGSMVRHPCIPRFSDNLAFRSVPLLNHSGALAATNSSIHSVILCNSNISNIVNSDLPLRIHSMVFSRFRRQAYYDCGLHAHNSRRIAPVDYK